jgi:hypothetical protein
MEKAASANLASYVDRRLHPVRLSVGLLNRLMEDAKGASALNVNRDLLFSISSTIELFIEDFEANCLPPGEARKGLDKTDTPRVTQTRVG